MNVKKLFFGLVILTTVGFASCKPKDADVKTAVENKLKESPATANVMVAVTDGVTTLSGEVADDAAKTMAEGNAKETKGVKSVTNNLTITQMVVAPPVIAMDDQLSKNVMDATKDYPGVTATVTDGVVMVAGTISIDKWKQLKMTLDGLNPKKVDGSALTIK